MKQLLTVGILALLCIGALLLLKRAEGIAVDVVSSVPDGRDEVVTVRYTNRLSKKVLLSFDILLGRDFAASRSGRNTMRAIKVKHFSELEVGPHSEGEKVVRIALPPGVSYATPFILNLEYRLPKETSAMLEPNQAPEPRCLLVTIRAFARLAPSRHLAHL